MIASNATSINATNALSQPDRTPTPLPWSGSFKPCQPDQPAGNRLVGRKIFEASGLEALGHILGLETHLNFAFMPEYAKGLFRGVPWAQTPVSQASVADYTGGLFAGPKGRLNPLQGLPEMTEEIASEGFVILVGFKYLVTYNAPNYFVVFSTASQVQTHDFWQDVEEQANHTLRPSWDYRAGDLPLSVLQALVSEYVTMPSAEEFGYRAFGTLAPFNYAEKMDMVITEQASCTEEITRLIARIGNREPDQITHMEFEARDLSQACFRMKALNVLEACLEASLPCYERSMAE